jgi:adenylate cyclase
LADLANAYRLNGDTESALSTVTEAIDVATERNARVPECFARIVYADLLMKSEAGDKKVAGRLELERAQTLMRETGAMFFKAFVTPSKDKLDDAQASRHAKRVSDA